MPDLDDLARFAFMRGHNLTGRLNHAQVEALAEAWFPEIRFYEKERFHPVDLPDLLNIPPPIFAGMSEAEKERFRVPVVTGTTPDGEPVFERFDPPVVLGGGRGRVFGSGTNAADGMDDLDDLGRSGAFTCGARLGVARRFFGASGTAPAPTSRLRAIRESRGIRSWSAQSYACCWLRPRRSSPIA